MNKKEEFFTARRKALSTYGRYDFALLSDKYYGAKFADTGKVGIKNAFVFVNFMDHHTLEWRVENGDLINLPKNLELCIKSSQHMLMCIGSPEDENSIFIFRRKSDETSSVINIVGAIESTEGSIAFYFDWQGQKGYCIDCENNDDDESDIFEIMKKVLEQGELIHGRTEKTE